MSDVVRFKAKNVMLSVVRIGHMSFGRTREGIFEIPEPYVAKLESNPNFVRIDPPEEASQQEE